MTIIDDDTIFDYLVRIGARLSEAERISLVMLQNPIVQQTGKHGHHVGVLNKKLEAVMNRAVTEITEFAPKLESLGGATEAQRLVR